MNFKEIYEDLFGDLIDPIPPQRIPCLEISDQEKLCKNPLVSVRMATYNHEPWIAQAIEGVINQIADFEYELIIGEDCSSDRTREICIDYQRRFPEKIRVLWSNENVNKIGSGNSGRITARCRGEFIATCEGDDYWCNPNKLQKQVDLIREKGVDVAVAYHRTLYPDGTEELSEYKFSRNGLVSYNEVENHYFHTSTYLVRRSLWESVLAQHQNIGSWYDTILFPCFARAGDFAILPEVVSVYRRTGFGIMTSLDTQQALLFGIKQSLMRLIWFKELSEKFAIDNALSRLVYLLKYKDYPKLSVARILFWKLVRLSFPSIRSIYSIVKYII